MHYLQSYIYMKIYIKSLGITGIQRSAELEFETAACNANSLQCQMAMSGEAPPSCAGAGSAAQSPGSLMPESCQELAAGKKSQGYGSNGVQVLQSKLSSFSSILDLFSLSCVSLFQHFPEVPNKTGCTFDFSTNCPPQYPALKDANGSFTTECRGRGSMQTCGNTRSLPGFWHTAQHFVYSEETIRSFSPTCCISQDAIFHHLILVLSPANMYQVQ